MEILEVFAVNSCLSEYLTHCYFEWMLPIKIPPQHIHVTQI